MGYKKITDIEVNLIISLYKEKNSCSRIAKIVNIDRDTVKNILIKYGVFHSIFLSKDEIKLIILKYRNGDGISDIAKSMKKSTTLIYSILHKNGIILNKTPTKSLNKDNIDLIISLYKKGISAYKIGKQLHHSLNTVKKILITHNLYVTKRMTENEIIKTINLYNKNLTIKEISSELNRDVATIKKCILMKKPKSITKNEINNIITLYNEGESIDKISKKLIIFKDNVKKILIKYNILNEKKLTNEDKDKIKNIYVNNRLSMQQIAKMYNLTKNPKVIKKILIKDNILRKRRILTDNEKQVINQLYINDKIPISKITNIIHAKDVLIYKYLKKNNLIRSISDANELKLNNSELSYRCKFYNVNGLRCQGSYEKFYIEKLIMDGKELPNRGNAIKTPYGIYYSDFEFNDRIIEIKCDYTYNICIGKIKNWANGKFESKQYNKIKWVNENIKPVDILIVDKKHNTVIKKEIKNCH